MSQIGGKKYQPGAEARVESQPTGIRQMEPEIPKQPTLDEYFRDTLARLEGLRSRQDLRPQEDNTLRSLFLSGLEPPDKYLFVQAEDRFADQYCGNTSGAMFHEPELYDNRKFERLRIRLYESRFDRYGTGIVLAVAVAVGFGAILRSSVWSTSWLAGVIIQLVCIAILFQIVQSARTGYLMNKNWNHIDDMVASLPGAVLRGHHRVHRAEQELVARARHRNHKLLVLDLWSQNRSEADSPEFRLLARDILDYGSANPANVEIAVAANASTWPQCERLLYSRMEAGMKQRFFLENPLQCDVVLTPKEAILSFPRANSNRSFALHIKSQAASAEFWDILQGQVGEGSAARFVFVNDEDGIRRAAESIRADRDADTRPLSSRRVRLPAWMSRADGQ